MAKLHGTSYTPKVPHTGDYVSQLHAEFDALHREKGDALKRYEETGDILGAIYSSPYADSSAIYKVMRVSPLTVAHVAVGDAWQLPAPHVKGLDASDIKGHLESQLRWRDIAAKR